MSLHMKPFDHDELLKLDGDVPFVRSVPYGIQHILAMFAANLVLPRDMEVKVAASQNRRTTPKSNGSVKRALTFGYSVKEPRACGFACQNRRAT